MKELITIGNMLNSIIHDDFSTTPEIEILKDDNNYHVKALIPGYDEKDITVKYENGSLEISGKRELKENSDRKLIHREFNETRSFSRVIKLNTPIDTEKTKADLKNGELKIELPFAEAAKPRTIKISS